MKFTKGHVYKFKQSEPDTYLIYVSTDMGSLDFKTFGVIEGVGTEGLDFHATEVIRMNLFRGSSKRSTSTVVWNRKTILEKIVSTIDHPEIELRGNRIQSKSEDGFFVEFLNSNYSDKSEIQLIANIYIKSNGKEYELCDIFNLVRELKGKKYRALTINKNANWDKSAIKKETLEIYKPLFVSLTDRNKTIKLLSGENVEVDGNKFSLPRDEWLLSAGKDVVMKLAAVWRLKD